MKEYDFDPNAPAVENGNYFGFPFAPEDSELVIVSAPWDVTVSYGQGSSAAPDAIIGASTQLDFHDPHHPGVWRRGIATLPVDYSIQDQSLMLRPEARKVIKHLETGGHIFDDYFRRKVARINEASAEVNQKIYAAASEHLLQGRIVALVGGDHSTPLGLMRAAGECFPGLGILHIDAHADLREAYEGFTYSHASIMYNALQEVHGLKKVVQVGIRDLCEEEAQRIASDPRLECFDDHTLAQNAFTGMTWDEQCRRIVDLLPQSVHISLDIDGLSPENCPHTGTPVPGGLSFNQAVHLIATVERSGRRIVALDLCEVVPAPDSEWDANVGARILFKLCNFALATKKEEQ